MKMYSFLKAFLVLMKLQNIFHKIICSRNVWVARN